MENKIERLEDQLIYIGKVNLVGKGELRLSNIDMNLLLNKNIVLKSKDVYSIYIVDSIRKGLILKDLVRDQVDQLNGSEAYLAKRDMALLDKLLPIELVGMKVFFKKKLIGEVIGVAKSKFYDILSIRSENKKERRDSEIQGHETGDVEIQDIKIRDGEIKKDKYIDGLESSNLSISGIDKKDEAIGKKIEDKSDMRKDKRGTRKDKVEKIKGKRDREEKVYVKEYNIPNTDVFIKNLNRKKREIELNMFEETF